MNFKRKGEVFLQYRENMKNLDSVSFTPPKLYPQERDWTCAVACIRTILSAFGNDVSEDELINKYSMTPGPYFSKDIKKLGLLENLDVIYGCDLDAAKLDTVIDYMKDGYYIMVESMINFAHWHVVLGYYTISDFTDVEKFKFLMYDPYYNELKLVNVDEFDGMWLDGNHAKNGIEKDFIAIRKSK